MVGFLCAVVLQSASGAAPAGTVWEVTSQNVMEGMPMQMPAQTSTVCAANDVTHPPERPNCANSNFKRSGNTVKLTGRKTAESCANPQ
jgi:hypothetical protein